jgi:mannose/fructose/N-acetylgalactosamine-specific phosphotransferase system component IIC
MIRAALICGQFVRGLFLGGLLSLALLRLFSISGSAPVFRYAMF